MILDTLLPLSPSDFVLLVDFVIAIAVAVYFTFGGKLFSWSRDSLGWVIFSYAAVTVGLLLLIVWAIVFGERMPEWFRFLLATGFGVGLVAKGWSMRNERRKGRIARDQLSQPEGSAMSIEPFDHKKAVEAATEIWYKGKRVLRTFVQVVIPSFLGFAVVFPLVIQAAGFPVESGIYVWLIAVSAGVSGVAAGLARIMAIPQVNAWLIKVGLGSVPESAVQTTLHGANGAHGVVVIPEAQADRHDG